eukprot:scaffold233295_cov43-Tisochrysis_lutea.AAC.1
MGQEPTRSSAGCSASRLPQSRGSCAGHQGFRGRTGCLASWPASLLLGHSPPPPSSRTTCCSWVRLALQMLAAHVRACYDCACHRAPRAQRLHLYLTEYVRLLTGEPGPFATRYTLGNVLAIASSSFLVGPQQQVQRYPHSSYWASVLTGRVHWPYGDPHALYYVTARTACANRAAGAACSIQPNNGAKTRLPFRRTGAADARPRTTHSDCLLPRLDRRHLSLSAHPADHRACPRVHLPPILCHAVVRSFVHPIRQAACQQGVSMAIVAEMSLPPAQLARSDAPFFLL